MFQIWILHISALKDERNRRQGSRIVLQSMCIIHSPPPLHNKNRFKLLRCIFQQDETETLILCHLLWQADISSRIQSNPKTTNLQLNEKAAAISTQNPLLEALSLGNSSYRFNGKIHLVKNILCYTFLTVPLPRIAHQCFHSRDWDKTPIAQQFEQQLVLLWALLSTVDRQYCNLKIIVIPTMA